MASTMTPEELRAMQAPLKERYRADPAAALVTLRARGTLGDDVHCAVHTPRGRVNAGLHPATGGTGELACSGDMLLEALVACAGVTLRAVATSLQIPISGGTVHAEGDLDFRGTMAVSKEAPVGFTAKPPQIQPLAVGAFGEKKMLCRMSPKPDWLPAPGWTSLCQITGRIVRVIRFQSLFSENGMTG